MQNENKLKIKFANIKDSKFQTDDGRQKRYANVNIDNLVEIVKHLKPCIGKGMYVRMPLYEGHPEWPDSIVYTGGEPYALKSGFGGSKPQQSTGNSQTNTQDTTDSTDDLPF